MSARGDAPPRRRQRRAPMACDFCRHRKMKCDNLKPQCRNCEERGKDCIYAELVKKPRPSTARIAHLEQENRRLQETLSIVPEPAEDARNRVSSASSCALSDTSLGMVRPQPSDNPCRPPSTRSERLQNMAPAFSPDKESSYHGPTSVVFDEKSTEAGSRHNPEIVASLSDVWVRRQLVAESARQRQLETVNFLAGKLDFDGIEPELGMHLLSMYWNRQHSSGPVEYRTAFMRDMACAGPHFSKLLLNAIYFYSSKYTSHMEVRQDQSNKLSAGWKYRQRAVELLGQCFGKSNITTIQALLIMASAIFSWCDEKSTSWLYAGMAFNMIIDLGMHINPSTLRQRFSEEELEVRRRVFWVAYYIDKLQSLYQGRPACLREYGTNYQIKFLDDYEELELFGPLSYTTRTDYPVSPVYSVSTFTETCKLSMILDKILLGFYSENTGRRVPGDLLQESKILHTELCDWRKALPQHLDLNLSDSAIANGLPHTLSLTAMFNILIILLHRPFVSDGNLNSISSFVASNAFSQCSAAAFEIDKILRVYERSFDLSSVPYALHYATYVSATIHVRLATQAEHRLEAQKALRKCLSVLELHQVVCWSAKRAKRIIDGLVARMGVVVSTGMPFVEADLVSPSLNIEAIIRTFVPGQPPTEPENQRLPAYSDLGLAGSGVPHSTSLQLPSMPTFDDSSFNQDRLSATGNDLEFFYDPIFGFRGNSWDEFDIDFGDALT